MSYATNKADFVRDCFRTVLNDGQPHRYREILAYTRQQAEGTEFDGEIESNNLVLAFKALIGKPDSEYERVRHGIYQKCTPETEMRKAVVSGGSEIYSILDRACELQEQMKNAFALCSAQLPDIRESIKPAYKYAYETLDASINGISAWIAQIEDYTDNMSDGMDEDLEETEDTAPTMQM